MEVRSLPALFRWLGAAALVDWLIPRTLSRSAIFMPKSDPVIAVYRTMTWVGAFATTALGLLVLLAAAWIAGRMWRSRSTRVLAAAVAMLAGLHVVGLISPLVGALQLTHHVIVLLLLTGILRISLGRGWSGAAALAPSLAVALGAVFQGLPAAYRLLRLPGPPPVTTSMFLAGEVAVLASPVIIYAFHGRGARLRDWILAALPALVLAAMLQAQPSLAGILAIWSVGLTLALPWPLYVISLWLAGVTVIAGLRRGHPACLAVLLLTASGYAPQLTTHGLLALVGLWLLAAPQLLAGAFSHGRVLEPERVVQPGPAAA